MSALSNKAERLCAMFDSYCKTVLRNESQDIKRALVRRSKRELAMDEPMQYILNLISHKDAYPFERLTLHADRFSGEVYNLRQRAFNTIRNYYEKKGTDK